MHTKGSISHTLSKDSSLWKDTTYKHGNPRPAERLVTPFPGFLNRGKSSFLYRLLRCEGDEKSQVFGTIIAVAVVNHKWKSSAKARFQRETVGYMLSLVAAVAASFLTNQQSTLLSVLLVLLGAWALYDISTDAIMAWSTGLRRHANDLFNWLRFAAVAATAIALVFHFGNVNENSDSNATGLTPALAVLVYCKWIGLYYYLQPLHDVGPVIRMIVAIIFDIRYIVLAMLIAILALSNALFTLLDKEQAAVGFVNPADAIYTTYKMLLLSEFDDNDFVIGKSALLIQLLFVVTAALGPVVLLNLLIARMNDAYEHIQDQAEDEQRRLQALIILRYELLDDATGLLDGATGGFDWLHVVVPQGQNKAKVGRQKWAGVLNDVKERLGEKIAYSDEKVDEMNNKLNTKVDEMKKEMNTKVDEMKKEMSEIKKEMATMTTKLDRIIAAMAKTSHEDGEESGFGFPSK